MTEKTPIKWTGWAHAAGSRTGHYLDCGYVLCGRDPKTHPPEMDLRADPPAEACGKCAAIVDQYGGTVPHEHRWADATNQQRAYAVCPCGAAKDY